jgi:uncharacterized protein DUF481
MRTPHRSIAVTGIAVLGLLAAASPGHAAVVPGWYSTTDLMFAMATGNSQTFNLGVNLNVTRQWLRTDWKTTATFQRTDVNEPTRRAFGPASDPTFETGPSVTKSEKLFFNTVVNRRITERVLWNAGGSLERDIFAGLRLRSLGQLGVGYLWLKPDNSNKFQLGVAATYTSQDEVVDDPETENQFFGVRFSADDETRFGERQQHVFTSTLIVDENLQQTDDLRFNWSNSLAVGINNRFALKVGLQFAYDNLPQLVEFDLFLRGPGGALIETGQQVPGRGEKLDTTASVSLVINFAPGNQRSGGR